jgi:hypothetical protein
MPTTKQIRKEVAIRRKELINQGLHENLALNQARKEANEKYGKDWREKDWKGDGTPMHYFPWMRC